MCYHRDMDAHSTHLSRIDLLDMVSSLDCYACYLRQQLHSGSGPIEDGPLRDELVTSTWLSEKLSMSFMDDTPAHELRHDEWECLLQALETHIGNLSHYISDTNALQHEKQLTQMNLEQAHKIKQNLLSLAYLHSPAQPLPQKTAKMRPMHTRIRRT